MSFGGFLQANTQVKVVIGPVVAVGDGFTPVTTLALGTADEAELMKHDAAGVVDVSGNTFAAITNMDGYYNLTLTTTDTNTEGMLTVGINDDSLCLPVKASFMVLSQAAYASMYTAKDTGYMDANVKAVSEDTTAADNLELACDNYSVTRGLTGTALPAAAADAAGGLPISDAGGLDLDSKLANTNEITAARMGALTDWINGGRLDLILDIIAEDTTTDIPALIAALNDLSAAQVNTEVDTALSDYDPPTKTEMDAAFTEIKGATWASGTDTLEHIRNKQTDIETDTQDLQTQIGTAGAGLTDLGGMSAGMKAEVEAEVDNAMDNAIASNPTARSANDMLLRAGTALTGNMTINETTGAYSMKKVNDEATEETFGGSKAAAGTVTSGAGVTTRNPS